MSNSGAQKIVQSDYLSIIHKAVPESGRSGEDAVFQTDLDFKITGWNTQAEECCGHTFTVGHYLFDDADIRFAKGSHDDMLAALSRKDDWSGQVMLKKNDGELLTLRITVTKITNLLQSSQSIVFIAREIKEKKARDLQLQAAEYKFEALVNSLPDGVMMIDANGFVSSCNNRGLEILGLTKEEIVGRPATSTEWRVVHLNGAPFPPHQFPSVVSLQTGFPQRNVIMGIRQPGGHRLWLSVNSEALIHPDEFEPYAVVLTFSDITLFILTEQELMESNERFHYVTKITSDAIWDFDLVKNEIYRSETFSRLSGYSPAEIGSNLNWWVDRIHPDDRERVKQNLEKHYQQQHERWEDEYRFEYADGHYKVLHDRGLIFYQQGKPVRILGAIRDITDETALRQKLREEQEKKNHAVAIAALMAQENEKSRISRELHDNVNQILMSAKLYMESARQDTEKADIFLEKAIEYQLLALHEIRKISRTLSTPGVNNAGLEESINDIVKNLEALQQIEVDFVFDPAVDGLLSNEEKVTVYRVIQEQTSNIIKYASATKVCINVAVLDHQLQLVISDNGKGFDPDYKDGSKGIGLFNMQCRARSHYGSFSVRSAVGKGCIIEMRFPPAAYSPTITNAPQK